MAIDLRPVSEQVIVITGASSGIGLATARRAVAAGAKVVLVARSEQRLDREVEEMRRGGGDAIRIVADVASRAEMERVAAETVETYGRIDTWINDAGVSIYGRLEDVSEEDSRRLFDVNFWGVVNGSLAALPHLRRNGGALVNVGSEVSDAVIGLQGMYSASKHAVKGFTDALRIEVEELGEAPVSITLVQPTATDTPFPQHARNYMPNEPALPTPLDDPEDVAEAILEAAAKPRRNVVVGLAKLNVATAKLAPRLGDKMSAKQSLRQQYEEPPRDPEGSLFRPSEDGSVRGTGGPRA
jgi:short-subunit dehydrogenase